LGSKLEDKRFCTERKQTFSDFNQPLISPNWNFDLLLFFPLFHLSRDLLSICTVRFFLHSILETWPRTQFSQLFLPDR
jgi:hypothetical protein